MKQISDLEQNFSFSSQKPKVKRSEDQKVTFHLQNKVLAHVKKFLEPHTDFSGSLITMKKHKIKRSFRPNRKALKRKLKYDYYLFLQLTHVLWVIRGYIAKNSVLTRDMVTDVNKFACVPNKDAVFLPDANLNQITSFH